MKEVTNVHHTVTKLDFESCMNTNINGHYQGQEQITCTIMKIALRSCTKQSDDRLLNLLARDAPPPKPLIITKLKMEQKTNEKKF